MGVVSVALATSLSESFRDSQIYLASNWLLSAVVFLIFFYKTYIVSQIKIDHKYCRAVFHLTLWLIGKCPNFLKTILPKALERCLGALT